MSVRITIIHYGDGAYEIESSRSRWLGLCYTAEEAMEFIRDIVLSDGVSKVDWVEGGPGPNWVEDKEEV